MWKWIIVIALVFIAYSNLTAEWRQPSKDPHCRGKTNQECDIDKRMENMSEKELQTLEEELREEKYNESIRK